MTMKSETDPLDLDAQQVALAAVQEDDFRAANLNQMVASRLAPGSVLDVGCGGGGLVASLLRAGHDARGIDVSPPIIAAAKRYFEGHGFDPERVSAEPLASLVARGARFDNVVSMDCLEHVENDEAMFSELVEIVRPGGTLVITVPALSWIYGQRDADIGHYRRYEKSRLRALIVGRSLRIEELRFWNVLGVLPRLVNEKLLGRRMDESFRYGEVTLKKRLLRGGLDLWFSTVERWVRPPLGLTLVMKASREL
ncbi:MAG: methyltransferase domain-containing protein [Deltaproteobacteria bacterium]|nr:methyltransferase domain-containing protein [Deltaproteobacteria bacterium]